MTFTLWKSYLVLLACIISGVKLQQLPSVYEYFTEGGIKSNLIAENKEFWLNGKEIKLIGGAMHYFRIHPSQWRDRLRKLRALGANTVETYVSWNLHEPQRGQFDFGGGNNDFSEFMDIRRFIQLAQEEDLLVILRPGPYICAEWEWGGFPSWLANDPGMKVRENYQPFLDRVNIFFYALLSKLVDFKFSNGGSIIALQLENEYAAFNPISKEYLEFIRQSYLDNGFGDTLFFTADHRDWLDIGGGLPGVLQMANTHDPDGSFVPLMQAQPDMPLMAMEYYTGWMTTWGDERKGSRNPDDYFSNLDKIFRVYNGSVNFYMFHGGTNYGFMNGANAKGSAPFLDFKTTNYDYDALITEAGDYNLMYNRTAEMIEAYAKPKLRKPARPNQSLKTAYPTASLTEYLTYSDILEKIPSTKKVILEKPVAMEKLPINNGNGQSFGYIIYRKTGQFNQGDSFRVSWPRDFAQLLIDGQQIQTGFEKQNPEYWINSVKEFPLNLSTNENHTLDVMIENMGRVHFGSWYDFVQDKGIAEAHKSKIEVNDNDIKGVEIIAAEFSNSWVQGLTGWKNLSGNISTLATPALLRSSFTIADEPTDTFIDMSDWHKGIVFVNGFNIGRYFRVGPQYTLYAPAALLKRGVNEITIFEQLNCGKDLRFTTQPIIG